MSDRNELARRIAKLERALRWYANPKNWGEDDWGVRSIVQPPEYGKPGTKARQALGLKEPTDGR